MKPHSIFVQIECICVLGRQNLALQWLMTQFAFTVLSKDTLTLAAAVVAHHALIKALQIIMFWYKLMHL